MHPGLVSALTELDACTADLLQVDLRDTAAVAGMLEARTRAIQRVLLVVDETGGHDAAVLECLATARTEGERLSRRALQAKQELLQEWGRLQQLAKGYGGASNNS